MLRLILGRSGAGKTLYAIEKAGECAGPVVLLVPEQFTFEAEKLLLQRLGPQAGLHIEALSFTRLAQRVFREYGGLARRYIDDCGRMIVMRLALRQVGDLLAVYRRQAASPAFIETMVGAAAEYKACGVTPALLGEAAQKLGGGLLYEKISDLSLIMGAYDALLGKSLSDSNDDLARLGDCLLSHRFFAGKTVIVDSFKGFTPQERRVLGLILPQADEVYVTLCTDTIDDAEHGLGLFSPVRHTARQLIAEAEKAGTAVATPVRLGEPQRFQNDALRHLERFVFRGRAEQFAQDAPPIHIVSASNIYDEAQYAAQTIASLVRETGCRYREIVVIAGEPELYRGVIDPVFEKYDIPLFLDFRRGVDTHPLMALALSLFEIVLENFRAGPIFRCLKTGLPGLTTAETALLENYVLMWDIRGFEDWGRQWQSHPAGFGKALTEADAATLKEINGIRERVFMPLAAFKAATEKAQSSGDFCRCLYDRLCADGVDRRLPELCAQLRESGELELADEYLRMWETLMGLLDQLALTLGGFPVTAREFYQLMRLGIAGCDIGHIPASLDQVTFGGAQRIRAGEPRYVFVLGLAEGIFPKNGGAGGIFTQSERRRLAEAGLEIVPDAQEQATEERFFAYKAFTCASQGVWLCCPRSDPAGRALRPSQYLAAVKAIFPLCGAPDDALENPLDALQNEASAFEALALGFRKGGDLPTALKAYFGARPEYAQRLAALERVARREPFAFRDRQAARALYGEEIHISPSRLETHRQCRFAYFCRYGLNAAPRRKAELAAPEIGTL
ncbi:MAG: PD-(D/E)XK nuclease family protein, partial [Clostridia bacterium]|nr:PD-(D/E)XK nuclease family protein [Clostridia bacterium]